MNTEGNPPPLSVILPVCDGADTLPLALAALQASTLDGFEVIVVDDGSTDNSALIAEDHGFRVLRRSESGGPAIARNEGVAAALSDQLLFIDADVQVLPDTLAHVCQGFQDHPDVDAFFGSYTAETPVPGSVSAYKNLVHHHTHQNAREDATSFWTGCGAIRKTAFNAVDGFDVDFPVPCVEDIDMGYRLSQSGHTIRVIKHIQVSHLKVYSLVGLIRSDVFGRAIPWTALMLRRRVVRNDLNTSSSNALALILVYLALLGLMVAPWFPPALWITALGLVGMGMCNTSLLSLALQTGGLGRFTTVFWLHALFYVYSGAGLILGIASFLLGPRDAPETNATA